MDDIHIVLDSPDGDDPIEFDMPRTEYMEISRIAVANNMTWHEALDCILTRYREAHPVLAEAEVEG